jgi:hypothetical protein
MDASDSQTELLADLDRLPSTDRSVSDVEGELAVERNVEL